MPKVSVVIPVYKVERYVGRCIESIQNQSLKDIEIIMVNDGTPDKSMEIVKRYAFTDNRIIILDDGINHGPMIARYRGYSMAKGDYITFCDSDDALPQNALELLYNKALETGADIVSGNMQWVYDDGTTTLSMLSLPYGSDKEAVYRALLSKKYSHTLCCKMFKRNLLQEHEYITLDHHTNGEDGMLFYQVLQHTNKVIHLNKVVYYYYQNSLSSTHVRLKDLALARLVDFYNYVVDIPFNNQELIRLAICYSTECINEFAVNQGYARMKKIVMERGSHPYLSFLYRLKYMTLRQNLRWYAKYVLSTIKQNR